MSNRVDAGAISGIMGGATGSTGFQPVVQVVSLKKMGGANTPNDRWRLVLSDGQHFAQSMLATQQNDMITTGVLQERCLIKLMDYIVNTVQGKKLIIVLQLQIQSGPMPKIGNPVNVAEDFNTGIGQMPAKNNNTGLYSQGRGGDVKPYKSSGDVKPNPVSNKSAPNPYGGSGAYGSVRGGGASNPYSKRSTGHNSGPVQLQKQDNVYMPLSVLNPYQNRWTVKARITNKSDMRHWSNAKGEGNLFSIDLLDENNSEMRGTFFKQDADKWEQTLQVGHVYSFSGGRIKVANKAFSALNSEYEITFDSATQIIEITDDNRISSMTYNFVKLSEMESMEPNSIVDVIAVIKGFEDFSVINTKAGKEVEKRNLVLVDDTCTEISMTLWGATAKQDGGRWENSPVVGFKGVKLSDFNGRSLSAFNSSTIVMEPDVPETNELHAWFNNAGAGSNFKSVSTRGGGGGGSDEVAKRDISERYTLDSIRENKLGHGEKPDYALVKATISFITLDQDRDPWYTACPKEGCNKKVVESLDGGWQCEKCNQTYPDCNRRYILNMTMSDHTGRTWVTAFNDIAEPLLGGKSANDMAIMKDEGELGAFEEVFTDAWFHTHLVTLRVKQEMVNDELRLKSTIQRMVPIDTRTECQALLDAIAKY